MQYSMASDELRADGNQKHQMLADFLKGVHLSLRLSATKIGPEKAWQEHCQDKEILNKYAKFMETLATQHWGKNESQSRITWSANFCHKYFLEKEYETYNTKEQIIADKIDIKLDCLPNFNDKIKLLDVGSCYNPFEEFKSFLDVTPIDLCPANKSVLQCDILDVPIGSQTVINQGKVEQLQEESFEAVVFSFLLEYIPSSDLRISACTKAYSLLKTGGLLIICTPDSKHVGANAKLMKTWRYTLALLGFNRIHYSKYAYIHCMAFRKSLHVSVAARWAELHKQPFMDFAIHIPQDFNKNSEESVEEKHDTQESSAVDFEEMPFCNDDIL